MYIFHFQYSLQQYIVDAIKGIIGNKQIAFRDELLKVVDGSVSYAIEDRK